MGNHHQKTEFFGFNRTLITASAPGRMDVMGGIADYSGSLLLEMPIAEQTHVSIARREDNKIKIYSVQAEEAGMAARIEMDFEDLYPEEDNNVYYSDIRDQIHSIPGGDWAIYVLGCYLHLLEKKRFKGGGLDIFVESDVPFGKGVSSSAALEIATMKALDALFQLRLGTKELPVLAQEVENLIVGAPCGLMDQLTSYLGQKDMLLPLICQPDQSFEPVRIPSGVHFVGIDSGVRHAVSGASYGNVRKATFMGYTIIALAEGADFKDLEVARKSGDWRNLPFGGYLANIPVADFENKYLAKIPDQMTGAAFINKYKLTIDNVTDIDSKQHYKIKNCTSHPVYENERVHKFLHFIKSMNEENKEDRKLYYLEEMGQKMYGSHESYSRCGLGNAHTDEIVKEVKTRGAKNGLFGAKITGGGNGGTVCVLAYGEEGEAGAREIAANYGKKYNLHVSVFSGSSEGAANLEPIEETT